MNKNYIYSLKKNIVNVAVYIWTVINVNVKGKAYLNIYTTGKISCESRNI